MRKNNENQTKDERNINKNIITGEEALNALYRENTPEDDEQERLNNRIRIVIHLKQRMKERNLTQKELSELTGVRQATISQLSRGYIERLHIPTLEKIAAALNITDIRHLLTFEIEGEIMNMANPFDVDFSE